MNNLILLWTLFFNTNPWQELIKNITPHTSECGLVYELPEHSNPGQDLAIVDMTRIRHTDPHYHTNSETELYFVLQGTGIVVVGTIEHSVQQGDVIVTPPETTHFVIPIENLVIGVINTPSFNAKNYIVISETDPKYGFDKKQFDRLAGQHYKTSCCLDQLPAK